MSETEIITKCRYKSIQHVKSYPLVKQTHRFLAQLPATRVILANTRPVYKRVASSKPAQWVSPATRMVDSIADRGLEATDNWVPCLKTKTYQDLYHDAATPFVYTKDMVVKVTVAAADAADNYVYEPTHTQVIRFRKFYNAKIYDTNGKPLLRSSVDPFVAPYNKKLEKMTKHHFPEGKEVPTSGFSSEISRTVALTDNLLRRMSPVAQERLVNFVLMPCRYAQHVNAVFNENLDKQESLSISNSWSASIGAVTILHKESIEYVKRVRGKTSKKIQELDVPVASV
ncbi:LAME_0E13212g1_1 [Lachancea meyersii CBS 8951]|uniref:LAME_0E13212g1_1 n=1 Tax=Lachancea meyersii CBS 8951 TaxID=1266667 RepID=A0A1G4JM59_9SACH|nr:LAME_0E13212g1_1 [Lachancea meyersii CBS 8951]